MGAYSDTRQEYHKSRIRDIMILKPDVSAQGIQNALEASALDPIRLDRNYIKKLIRKIEKERVVKLDRAEIKERLSVMRETYNLVSEQMWKILLDGTADGKGRVAAGKVIIDAQKNLLDAEMNAGIFDRKLGTVAIEAGGVIEHHHQLDPAIKSQMLKALENYGLIRNVKYTIPAGSGTPERV